MDHPATVGEMLDALPTHPMGHNNPPLAELLVEETAALKKRADDLIASAGRAAVTDDDSAGRATTLAKLIGDHVKVVEDARVTRKQPFLEAGKTVDTHFKNLADPLARAKAAIVGLIDGYQREQRAKAEAERRRLEEAARAEQERAAEAARKRAADETPIGEALDLEIDQRAAEEAAARLVREAAAVQAAPILGAIGSANERKTYRAEITDLTAAIRHARKIDEAAVKAAIQAIFDKQVRAGVRELPGALVHEEIKMVIR